MDSSNDLIWEVLDLTIDDAQVAVSTVRREGSSPNPLLILHGFGVTKGDYLDVPLVKVLSGVPVIMYDTPGSGQSTSQDLNKLSIPIPRYASGGSTKALRSQKVPSNGPFNGRPDGPHARAETPGRRA